MRFSFLTGRIVLYNLVALYVLVGGILWLDSPRQSLLQQNKAALTTEVRLLADVFSGELAENVPPPSYPIDILEGEGGEVWRTLSALQLRGGRSLLLLDAAGNMLGQMVGTGFSAPPGVSSRIMDTLHDVWKVIACRLFKTEAGKDTQSISDAARELMADPTAPDSDGTIAHIGQSAQGRFYLVISPILYKGERVGAVAIASPVGHIDALARAERERVLIMFLIAICISVALCLVLSRTIARPLAELARAVELDAAGDRRPIGSRRVRIPDFGTRRDEIGRLARALGAMVDALYDRIDANEQFAADVAHEIKNPLASLQSAVGTLRVAKREDQRETLMKVIEHDVRRLDRLVSDISNASRLDSELVKEEEEEFDLLDLVRRIAGNMSERAVEKGIDFFTDLPEGKVLMFGLEARLAQVFVNLIDNAISICQSGDAIRIWVRRREERVLIVVEDTGPGIPDGALQEIFTRFYSHRKASDFGNNSGLGLAISKQIVEAHGGVIWAENVCPVSADPQAGPLGARFVVGLPI